MKRKQQKLFLLQDLTGLKIQINNIGAVMAIKLTIKELSSKIGISTEEISKLLKTHGIEITSDAQELTPEDIKVIRSGMKKSSESNREKVSLSKRSTTPKSNKITIKRSSSSTTTVALKAPVVKKGKVKPIVTEKIEDTPSPKPKAEPNIVEIDIPERKPEPVIEKTVRLKPVASTNNIEVGAFTNLGELAEKSGISMQDLTQAFFDQGYMLKKNDDIDRDTATLLLEVVGVKVNALQAEKVAPSAKSKAKKLTKAKIRPPVVTIMGHVDHGKTSLIDYLRNTKVVQKESGGITQHIAAYQVPTSKGLITFLDTPGHEAFSSMRSRGAMLTDIIILVVDCNDGVKPQTIESIQHAQITKTPMIVALTKMDIADPERKEAAIKELSAHGIIAESWGGETMVCPISSKTGEGIEHLLESISLQAEMMELKASESAELQGCVVESRLDRGRGTVVTMIIEQGTLKIGQVVSIGGGYGKVRSMIDGSGSKVKAAIPSMPVEITGVSPAPNAQDAVVAHKDEKSARTHAQQFITDSNSQKSTPMSLELLFAEHASKKDTLNYIIKADTQGSLEALSTIIESLSDDQVEINIVHSSIGSINSSDASVAKNTGAEILGFHVNIESSAKKTLESQSTPSHLFKIIYQLIDHIKSSIKKLKGPELVEKQIGKARVKAIFRSSKFGQITGCGVLDGIIKRGAMIRVIRNDETIFDGELSSLKREKETITEARKGTECGLGLKNFSSTEVGDDIICYELGEKINE
ncbi:translation initiation factor IF-2 [Gammaproteobacteria bacterium]|nr:translation initiation factor IF-2 [Gammaproteobacteria bacterium]